MLLKKLRERKWNISIAFRLSSQHAFFYAISSLLIFVTLHWLVAKHIVQTKDQWILEEALEIKKIMANPELSDEYLEAHMKEEAHSGGIRYIFYCVKDQNGKILISSDATFWSMIINDNRLFPWKKNQKIFHEILGVRGDLLRIIYLPLPSGKVIVSVASIKDQEIFMKHLIKMFIFTYLLVIIVHWLFGYFMVKHALHPVQVITKIAQEVSMKNLSLRIPIKYNKDELADLSATLNQMLERIEHLIKEIKEMNENLAHDLRTLISRMRVNVEVSLLKKRDASEYRKTLAEFLEECDYLLRIVNTLLDISEVETGILSMDTQKLRLDELILDIVEVFYDVALHHDIELTCNEMPALYILGDRKKLRLTMMNLLDNAVKYTNPKGKILVSAFTESKKAVIKIEDSGVGIEAKDLPHIFTRFYRTEKSRTQSSSGLGLALSKAVIEAHQGTIEVQSELDKGSAFIISLPLLEEEFLPLSNTNKQSKKFSDSLKS